MTKKELIEIIRFYQGRGDKTLKATLKTPYGGVRYIVLSNLDGRLNGNPHDIWVSSRTYATTLGHIYLGSRRTPTNTRGWEDRIEGFFPPLQAKRK